MQIDSTGHEESDCASLGFVGTYNFVIEHREPRFHLEWTHVFGGNSDIFSIDLMTK